MLNKTREKDKFNACFSFVNASTFLGVKCKTTSTNWVELSWLEFSLVELSWVELSWVELSRVE